MIPITNSQVKERFRIKNENEAKYTEQQIRSRLASDILPIEKTKSERKWIFIGAAILLCFLGGLLLAFTGVVIGIVAAFVVVVAINSGLNNKIKSLKEQAENEIRNAYNRSDAMTYQEINAYDNEVNMYSQKIYKNAESISAMVAHVVSMFQRMISHADAGAHMRFIEADLTYTVIQTGINYSYQSRYSNPQDDYNFNRERFRDLKNDAECEGLAQALAKLTIKSMKCLYPPNSLNISVSHMDSQVTLHFKGANSNFIPARDIL